MCKIWLKFAFSKLILAIIPSFCIENKILFLQIKCQQKISIIWHQDKLTSFILSVYYYYICIGSNNHLQSLIIVNLAVLNVWILELRQDRILCFYNINFSLKLYFCFFISCDLSSFGFLLLIMYKWCWKVTNPTCFPKSVFQ